MKKTVNGKISKHSVFCLASAIILFQLASMSLAADSLVNVDVSPNIINIASERNGDIRIFTDVQYSHFITEEGEAFVYFNESDSVENIRATRDSWGNLILKFDLESLLVLEDSLVCDGSNSVKVVLVLPDDEHTGFDEAYIVDKKAPAK